MESGDPQHRNDRAVAQRLADLAPFVMFTVDGTGTITWTSGAVERLFGIAREELEGTNILDHIDLDWSAESLDSVGYAMTAAGLQRPMLFRLNRADGAQVVIEITANAQHDDPLVGGLAVYARPWDERWLLDQTLDAIAGNSPLHDTLDLLVGVMGAEILEGDGVVCYPDPETGALRTRASGILGPHQRAEIDVADTPWHRAMRTGEPQWSSVQELGPELAGEAAERGHRWCWAWPVATQDGDVPSGCLVLWRTLDEAPDHTCRASLDRLVRLTALLFEREAAAGALRFAARHDALTGLANRAAFFDRLQDALEAVDDGTSVGVLYVDLDGFKPINDELGHGVGDAVLVQVAARLRTAVRAADLVARIGGDEFTVLCPNIGHDGELAALAERLLDAVRQPIAVGDAEVAVGASMGIAAAAPGTCSIDVLIDAADQALYQVKNGRKGGWRFGAAVR
jgi:diguanylate cyclase (GGDEF)-like protein/PAS domain S-box-containing protein